MTLRELYFRNGNIDLLDDVVLKIGGQILTGKLYQFDKYFNLHVDCVGGISGNVYFLSEKDEHDKSFREFVLLYSNFYFSNGCVDVFVEGRFFNSVSILDIINCEWYERVDYSYKGNSVFFDKNLLVL